MLLFPACTEFIIYSACRTLLLRCEYLAEYFISVCCTRLRLETLKYETDLFALGSRSGSGGWRFCLARVTVLSGCLLDPHDCALVYCFFPPPGREELKRMAHSKARVTDGKVTYPPGVKEISDKISKEEMVRRLKVSAPPSSSTSAA